MLARNSTLGAIASAILLVALWLAGPGMVVAADFIPLKIGQTMAYTVTYGSPPGPATTETIKVTGLLAIPPSKIYYNLDAKHGTEYSSMAFRSTATDFYKYKGMGLEYIEFKNAGVGTEWSYVDEEGNTVNNKIEAIESVTVPAGTFDGCLKIHTWVQAIQGSDVYHWVKPGVGMIKEEDWWTDTPPKIMKLKSVTYP